MNGDEQLLNCERVLVANRLAQYPRHWQALFWAERTFPEGSPPPMAPRKNADGSNAPDVKPTATPWHTPRPKVPVPGQEPTYYHMTDHNVVHPWTPTEPSQRTPGTSRWSQDQRHGLDKYTGYLNFRSIYTAHQNHSARHLPQKEEVLPTTMSSWQLAVFSHSQGARYGS